MLWHNPLPERPAEPARAARSPRAFRRSAQWALAKSTNAAFRADAALAKGGSVL